ncbi:helix-turn-helix domain-containing protein [Metabacillus fastidiosus]|uniref:helix-turn-helix domain-containing protein n=1 Tax=Metabacillus fastidiosus TaxID=1458 RepID=UPI003D2CBFF6
MDKELTVEEFADFVRFMRKSINLSQIAFVQVIGVEVSTIGRWELAKMMPTDIYATVQDIREAVKSTIRNKSA